MATTKHSITLPDGTIANRSSKTRVYTHVVIAREDNRWIAGSKRVSARGSQKSVEEYTAKAETLGDRVETLRFSDGSSYGTRNAAEYREWAQHAQERVDQYLADADALDAGPAAGRWAALTWSQSRENAGKAARKNEVTYGAWMSIQVVPVTETREVKPRAKKATSA